MLEKINYWITRLIKERVKYCKCEKPDNRIKVVNNRLDMYCFKCGHNE